LPSQSPVQLAPEISSNVPQLNQYRVQAVLVTEKARRAVVRLPSSSVVVDVYHRSVNCCHSTPKSSQFQFVATGQVPHNFSYISTDGTLKIKPDIKGQFEFEFWWDFTLRNRMIFW
jgi:hypothetical protein